MVSPVRGLRPVEARRSATLNVPKPTRRTSPPPDNSDETASNVASTALAASALEISAASLLVNPVCWFLVFKTILLEKLVLVSKV